MSRLNICHYPWHEKPCFGHAELVVSAINALVRWQGETRSVNSMECVAEKSGANGVNVIVNCENARSMFYPLCKSMYLKNVIFFAFNIHNIGLYLKKT